MEIIYNNNTIINININYTTNSLMTLQARISLIYVRHKILNEQSIGTYIQLLPLYYMIHCMSYQ